MFNPIIRRSVAGQFLEDLAETALGGESGFMSDLLDGQILVTEELFRHFDPYKELKFINGEPGNLPETGLHLFWRHPEFFGEVLFGEFLLVVVPYVVNGFFNNGEFFPAKPDRSMVVHRILYNMIE